LSTLVAAKTANTSSNAVAADVNAMIVNFMLRLERSKIGMTSPWAAAMDRAGSRRWRPSKAAGLIPAGKIYGGGEGVLLR
jgi:hypothetical protein